MKLSELINQLCAYLSTEGDHVVSAAEGVIHLAHPDEVKTIVVDAEHQAEAVVSEVKSDVGFSGGPVTTETPPS